MNANLDRLPGGVARLRAGRGIGNVYQSASGNGCNQEHVAVAAGPGGWKGGLGGRNPSAAIA